MGSGTWLPGIGANSAAETRLVREAPSLVVVSLHPLRLRVTIRRSGQDAAAAGVISNTTWRPAPGSNPPTNPSHLLRIPCSHGTQVWFIGLRHRREAPGI